MGRVAPGRDSGAAAPVGALRREQPDVRQRSAVDGPAVRRGLSHGVLTVRSRLAGGAFLADHWRSGEVVRLLREHRPDRLVLQGQSLEPVMPASGFRRYAALFKAEADRVGTGVVLMSTWARPAGDEFYRDPQSGGSPREMQARLDAAYASLASELGVELAPVGLGWGTASRLAPDLQLLDGTQHPTRAGTYLAAALLFRTLFHASPLESEFLGGLPEGTAAALRRVAARTPEPGR